MVIAFVGNKVDLISDRKVDADEASEYARSQGTCTLAGLSLPTTNLLRNSLCCPLAGLFYAETSAKADNNVEQLFVEVAKRVPKTGANVRKDTVNIKAAVPQATAKKAGCC